jgi:hypothetical protein
MVQIEENLEDYLAKLNLQGKRSAWNKKRRKIDFILRKASPFLNNKSTACDIGIGSGYLLRQFESKGFKATGIDISKYLIEQLRKSFESESLNIQLIHGDITNVNLEHDSFDIITCLDVLEHIPGEGLKKAVENIKIHITKDGFLIGTLPLGENLDDNMVICPKCRHEFHRIGHYHSFGSFEQMQKLLEPDFKIIKMGYVPFSVFDLNFLNCTAFSLYRFLCKVSGVRKVNTVYFIAKPNKS